MRLTSIRRGSLLLPLAALLAMAMPATTAAVGAGDLFRRHDGRARPTAASPSTGTRNIAFGATVHITGDLTVAQGASLNDHGPRHGCTARCTSAANVMVGKGAVLGLGWNSPGGEGTLGPDTVGGNIVASQPLALQIGQVTIGGNLVSNGGGVLSTSVGGLPQLPDQGQRGPRQPDRPGLAWRLDRPDPEHGSAATCLLAERERGRTRRGPGAFTDSAEVLGSDVPGGRPSSRRRSGGNLLGRRERPLAAADIVPMISVRCDTVHGRPRP